MKLQTVGIICVTVSFGIIKWVHLWLVCCTEVRAGQYAGEAQDNEKKQV